MDTTNQIIQTLLQENNKLRDSKEKLYQKNKNLRQEVRNLNKANIDKLYSLRQLQDSVNFWKEQAAPQSITLGVNEFREINVKESIWGDSHGGGLPPGYGHNSGLTNPENDLKW